MQRHYLLSTLLVVTAACQQQQADPATNEATAANAANATVPERAQPALASTASPRSAGCADRLSFVMNPARTQAVIQDRMPAERLEQVRAGTERLFKEVAGEMCASGELPPTAFDAYDQVMVTDAEGASEPNIYPGERRTLNYELAFADDQTVPPPAEFRAAFLCMGDPAREGCASD